MSEQQLIDISDEEMVKIQEDKSLHTKGVYQPDDDVVFTRLELQKLETPIDDSDLTEKLIASINASKKAVYNMREDVVYSPDESVSGIYGWNFEHACVGENINKVLGI